MSQIVHVVQWAQIIRSSPAEAYWDLIRKVRHGQAKMISETPNLYWNKWMRRVRTRFIVDEARCIEADDDEEDYRFDQRGKS